MRRLFSDIDLILLRQPVISHSSCTLMLFTIEIDKKYYLVLFKKFFKTYESYKQISGPTVFFSV